MEVGMDYQRQIGDVGSYHTCDDIDTIQGAVEGYEEGIDHDDEPAGHNARR